MKFITNPQFHTTNQPLVWVLLVLSIPCALATVFEGRFNPQFSPMKLVGSFVFDTHTQQKTQIIGTISGWVATSDRGMFLVTYADTFDSTTLLSEVNSYTGSSDLCDCRCRLRQIDHTFSVSSISLQNADTSYRPWTFQIPVNTTSVGQKVPRSWYAVLVKCGNGIAATPVLAPPKAVFSRSTYINRSVTFNGNSSGPNNSMANAQMRTPSPPPLPDLVPSFSDGSFKPELNVADYSLQLVQSDGSQVPVNEYGLSSLYNAMVVIWLGLLVSIQCVW